MLGARREHAIGLETAFGDQIVDEDANVGFVAPKLERRPPCARLRRVDAGDETLRGRFLITGCPVDLAGEKQAADALGLERRVNSVGWTKSYSTA